MKQIAGILFILIGILSGLYIGGWMMFIQPIIECCKAFDAQILTGTMVGWTVVKCIFAAFVGSLIFYLGYLIGMLLLSYPIKRRRLRK